MKTELGPDATGVGWVYQYALVDPTGRHSNDELKSTQDWFLRYALQSVPGVAEVASVGGQARQFQVSLNPNKMASYRVTIDKVIAAVKAANIEGGGRLVEYSGREYMVRGRGYVKTAQDLESAVLKAENGTPIRLGDVATVSLGPEMRRGLADLDGQGDAVGGIVVMRQGENALHVIERVKEKLQELKASLPEGVEVVPVYDRSTLIERAIATVKDKLVEEMFVVSLVILVFLWHIPSAIIPIITIPLSVALAFIPMLLLGQNANLMSLAGIAISIGVLVDGAIVEVENAYKKLEHWNSTGRHGDFHTGAPGGPARSGPERLLLAAGDRHRLHAGVHPGGPGGPAVPPPGLLQEPGHGHRRHPGDHRGPGHAHAVRAHGPVQLQAALAGLERHPGAGGQVLPRGEAPHQRRAAPDLRAALPVRAAPRQGHHRRGRCCWWRSPSRCSCAWAREFMPRLGEGTILYMPSTLPGISETEAQHILQVQDRLIRTVPEVARVFGKAGRADTATDPAPFSMMETVIQLKPEDQWREKPRWFCVLGPGLAEGPCSGRSGATASPRRRSSPTWTRPCSSRPSPTPGPCPSRPASTCSPPASAPPWASRSTAPT